MAADLFVTSLWGHVKSKMLNFMIPWLILLLQNAVKDIVGLRKMIRYYTLGQQYSSCIWIKLLWFVSAQ